MNGRQKSKTFDRWKPAERFLTNVVKKVQDRDYREIMLTTFN